MLNKVGRVVPVPDYIMRPQISFCFCFCLTTTPPWTEDPRRSDHCPSGRSWVVGVVIVTQSTTGLRSVDD